MKTTTMALAAHLVREAKKLRNQFISGITIEDLDMMTGRLDGIANALGHALEKQDEEEISVPELMPLPPSSNDDLIFLKPQTD